MLVFRHTCGVPWIAVAHKRQMRAKVSTHDSIHGYILLILIFFLLLLFYKTFKRTFKLIINAADRKIKISPANVRRKIAFIDTCISNFHAGRLSVNEYSNELAIAILLLQLRRPVLDNYIFWNITGKSCTHNLILECKSSSPPSGALWVKLHELGCNPVME